MKEPQPEEHASKFNCTLSGSVFDLNAFHPDLDVQDAVYISSKKATAVVGRKWSLLLPL